MRLDFRTDTGLRQLVMEVIGWFQPFPQNKYSILSIHLCPYWLQLCPCHCPMMTCVGGARDCPLGLHHGSPLCLSVRLSLFPGVLCHRSPPRLICPCFNWPPAVLVAPNCVLPPFCVTYHCPGAPALPLRMPACPPACPPAHTLAPQVQR